jgi:hypothetical protein
LEPRARRAGGPFRQSVEPKEPRLGDLMIGRFRRKLLEVRDFEQGDVIVAAKRIKIDADQARLARNPHIRLLQNLARKRLGDALPRINGAAGQVPARHVCVAHEEHAILSIRHDGAHPEGHGAPNAVDQTAEPRENAGANAYAPHGVATLTPSIPGAGKTS